MTANQVETQESKLMVKLVPVALIQVLVLSARDSLKRPTRWLSMTVTPRLGLMTANQVETHSFKLTVKLEPVALIQVLVLNAKDSVRRLLKRWHSMMEIHRLGLINAIQIKILLPRRTQAVLVPLRMRRLMALSQELELSAKDSHNRSLKAELNTMVIARLGLINAIQLKTLLPRRTQAVQELMKRELEEDYQESELSAKDSHKRSLKLNTTVTPRLGLMTANQEETHLFRLMDKPVLEDLTQVLVLSAKDLIRKTLMGLINWLNMMVTPRHGSMTAIPVETHSLKPMVAPVL